MFVFHSERCCCTSGWLNPWRTDADTCCDAFGRLASCGLRLVGAPGQVLVSTLQFQLLAVTFLETLDSETMQEMSSSIYLSGFQVKLFLELFFTHGHRKLTPPYGFCFSEIPVAAGRVMDPVAIQILD